MFTSEHEVTSKMCTFAREDTFKLCQTPIHCVINVLDVAPACVSLVFVHIRVHTFLFPSLFVCIVYWKVSLFFFFFSVGAKKKLCISFERTSACIIKSKYPDSMSKDNHYMADKAELCVWPLCTWNLQECKGFFYRKKRWTTPKKKKKKKKPKKNLHVNEVCSAHTLSHKECDTLDAVHL